MSTTTFFITAGLVFLLITWAAIFDIFSKDFGSRKIKIFWGFMALIPFVGCLLYFVFGFWKGKRIKENP